MANKRMFHCRAVAGERTNQLSHLEFRLWVVYRLSADDFGVMLNSAESFIGAHPCLADEKPRVLRAAIERLINVRLIRRFESRGLSYLYSPDWQEYEAQKYARSTILPAPPAEFLATCGAETRWLFGFHPGGVKLPKYSRTDSEKIPEINSTECENDSLPRANANANANANGSWDSGGGGAGGGGLPAEAMPSPLDSPESRLWAAFRAGLTRLGLCHPVIVSPENYRKLAEIIALVPDEPLRLAAVERFFAWSESRRVKAGATQPTLGYLRLVLPSLLHELGVTGASETPSTLLDSICDAMVSKTNKLTVNTWIRPCEVVEAADSVTLRAPSEDSAAYLRKHYGTQLREAVGALRPGCGLEIRP